MKLLFSAAIIAASALGLAACDDGAYQRMLDRAVERCSQEFPGQPQAIENCVDGELADDAGSMDSGMRMGG